MKAAQIDSTHHRCQALIPVFEVLGQPWTGLILSALISGPARFSELSRLVDGISDRVLSQRLTHLSQVGLIERNVDAGPPVSVSYNLTPSGAALQPALDQLEKWARDHL